jgi:hypothetical protein
MRYSFFLLAFSLQLLAFLSAAPFPVELIQFEANLGSASDTFGTFGTGLATDGETTVVGAVTENGDRGEVRIFVRDGMNWTLQATLRANDSQAGDSFGGAVGLSGNTLVVGAQGDDSLRGSVYVFVRSGTNWVFQQKLMASDGAASDHFGVSLAISGDTFVAGAPGNDVVGAAGAGSVYVFVRSGTNWTQQQKLLAGDRALDDALGESVAIDGNTIVAGAVGEDDGGSAAGAAYVFVRTGTTWSQQQRLKASDAGTFDFFGVTVAIKGDIVIVGAPGNDDLAAGSGSAYVFGRTGTMWSETQKLLASDGGFSDEFGSALAFNGDALVIGAHWRATFYIFTSNGTSWAERVNRTGPAETIAEIAIGATTIVTGFGNPETYSGPVIVYGPSHADAAAVAQYSRNLLYYPNAKAAPGFNANQTAFRYKHLLYGQESNSVRARFELMSNLYGPAERDLANFAESEVRKGLGLNPDDPGLGNLLLDIYYDRTVAESILTKDVLTQVERVRFDPPPANGFVIDSEISIYKALLETNRFALDGYFRLLSSELAVYQPGGSNTTRWATTVLGFSSQYTATDWSAAQALGMPNTYPAYGDIATAWASVSANGQREFLELGYTNPEPINAVSIYETLNPGAVDKVSVRNPSTGLWQEVWAGTAAPAGNTSRIFTVTFPLTSFPVDAVRIDINSIAVSSWNEIDAVGITRAIPTASYIDTSFGHRLFQTLVPSHALTAATYINNNGSNVSVTANAMLFSGYKDVVLLFDLLREYGRSAATLGSLLLSRNGPGDASQGQDVINGALRLLFLQGNLLRGMFLNLPPPRDPSGVNEAIAGWTHSLAALETLRQQIIGSANSLGFEPDFLMLVQKSPGDQFDSFDALRERLNASQAAPANALKSAKSTFDQANTTYAVYRGFQDQLSTQLAQLTSSAHDRLFEIVGARPADSLYESTDPIEGSEIWQQIQSIEVAQLRIQRNKVQITNLEGQIRIEMERRGLEKGVNNAIHQVGVKYRNLVAPLDDKINTINAVQDAVTGAGQAFTVNKLLKGGPKALAASLVIGLVVQGGGDLLKGDLEKQKEELAAQERAEIVALNNQLIDINSDAKIKTWLLSMNTLAVDSQEAGVLLKQEIGRLVALFREKADLEARIAEADASLSQRYFADPVHRLSAQHHMRRAHFAFDQAQKWLFFMVRALEYKWNEPFDLPASLSSDGRRWRSADLFKVRNADELLDFYNAMVEFDALFQGPSVSDDRFDWFSVRDDFLGYRRFDTNGAPLTYVDPATGESVDATQAFRRHLRRLQDDQGQIHLEFSTLRQIPGGSFFRGPRFLANGQVAPEQKGLYLDKIRWMKIRMPGGHTTARSVVNGTLIYGGVSYLRNPRVGTLDPVRPNHLIGEMTPYSTRYWFFTTAGWRFQEALSATVAMLKADRNVPRLDGSPGQIDVLPSVQQIDVFKERSVATTGWRLIIPTVDLGTPVLRIEDIDDIEIYFYHYAFERLE